MSKTFRYYDFTLAAGASQVLLVDAAYFRLQAATGAVDITVEGFGTLPGLLVGQGIKDTPFKRIVIKDVSGAPNVGQVLVASQEFVDNRTYGVTTISGGTVTVSSGNIAISNTPAVTVNSGIIDLSAASLAALESIDLNAASLASLSSVDLKAATIIQLNRPQTPSGSYNTNGAMVANTALTVFAPGSNVNGALVLAAGFVESNSASFPGAALLAKASAPTTVVDGDALLSVGTNFNNATTVGGSANLTLAQFVPAGQGLYWISTTATSAASFRSVRYKLL